ncbi:MAG: exo-alpha-sialidase, partial [Alphaproteobacteria bacterium]|nr:exo-alpha-sialidase [Alphaproteobacteria bacterium]
MSDKLLVATRKGLLPFSRGRAGWVPAPPSFLGEPVSAVLADPRDGALYAALRLGHFGVKLHRSHHGG